MKSNFYPITFDFEEFDVQRIPFREGLLSQLRQAHNATHSFFRRGDFIYISPGTSNAETLGQTVRLRIQEHPQVVSSLIKHVFFRAVKDAQPTLRPEFYPFRFAAMRSELDLAWRHVPNNLRGVLTFKRITEVQFRDHVDSNERLVFGALINHRYKWDLSRNCKELFEVSFDLTNREVTGTLSPDYADGVVAPEISLLGRIHQVKGEEALIDTNDGLKNYSLKELHLHNSRENINAFLTWVIGESQAERVIRSIKDQETQKLKLSVTMAEIETMAQWLSKLNYRNYDSFGFRIIQDNSVSSPASFSLPETNLIFDLSKTRVHSKPSIGLNMYGPYSRSAGFAENSPRILVIFHRQNAGDFTKFLADLRDGIPGHQWFPSGMIGKYRLTSMSYHIEELTNYSVEEYLKAIERGLARQDAAFDLAIIETSDSFRRLSNIENPYFRAKAMLYMQGTSVQSIKPETVRSPTYTIDGIALQIYAKLGGTPWTIPGDQSVDRELVIGIGSTILRKSQYAGATQARYVGISTFFSADGKYLANSRTQNVAYEEYFDELLRNLKSALDRLSNEYSWNDGDRIRLIFHIFKPIKNMEADVVSRLVAEYPQYNIRFAFVTLVERHPYILYDEHQRGNNGKGTNVPSRGYALPLGTRECLVHLLGSQEVRTARHGSPTPILVRIHEQSTFLDLQYIVQQVFKFSRLSFRSFNPSYAPATILYANMLTRQLKELRAIPGWNSIVASTQLRQKKWFL
ncbi:hypothetical protein AHMF7605_25710 [Adhaeribacter arboris]|uniref:Protein argonaute n=1 Tax=Adhaeribacter arboris TaxID=2072846 RepID=A0A2T2YMB1_9BACT|nr:Piwi domain-containing protein [Adhaeribacter arboris]PSR56648.1 hypothetical protein AHMF7605_25710 [Adhaeribacter arboris]